MRDVLEDVATITGDDLGLGDAGDAHGTVAGGSDLGGAAEADGALSARRSGGGGRIYRVESTWRQGRGEGRKRAYWVHRRREKREDGDGDCDDDDDDVENAADGKVEEEAIFIFIGDAIDPDEMQWEADQETLSAIF